jgi:hypothetical protein
MPVTAVTTLFQRHLPDHITVSVDGVYGDLEPDEAIKDTRPVGCVVIRMPDFVADTFAHNLAALWEFGTRTRTESIGSTERALAESLFEAARCMGYRCTEGGLRLSPSSDDGQLTSG